MNPNDAIKAAIDQLTAFKVKDPPNIYVTEVDYSRMELEGIDMSNIFIFGDPEKYKTGDRAVTG